MLDKIMKTCAVHILIWYTEVNTIMYLVRVAQAPLCLCQIMMLQ
jgi:hypothetical protein